MSITQKLIAMMNGVIEVQSWYGRGSVFTVSIPQQKADDGVIGTETAQSLMSFNYFAERQNKNSVKEYEPMPHGSVLVVDDLETNLYVAKGLMEPYGLNIETALSGEDALEKIRCGSVYDIIFMDHMMPVMDGIITTSKIREAGYEGTVVALTANAIAGQAEQFLQKGFNDFISKPIDTRKLDAVLRKWIKDKGAKLSANSLDEVRDFFVIDGIDTTQGIASTGGTVEGYKQVLAVFVKDVEQRLAFLQNAPSKAELSLFITQAHAIKSASASIGAFEISDAAAFLEKAGKDGDLTALGERLPRFYALLKTAVRAIQSALENSNVKPKTGDSLYEESLKSHCRTLKLALQNQDIKNIDRALAELSKLFFNPNAKEKFEAVCDAVLVAEYDKALAALSALENII
jgi:CheY-like chemotaxis protein